MHFYIQLWISLSPPMVVVGNPVSKFIGVSIVEIKIYFYLKFIWQTEINPEAISRTNEDYHLYLV